MKRALALAVFVAPALACSIGETNYAEVTLPATQAATVQTCNSPFVAVDVSTLTACGEGAKGHCYDATKVPIDPTQLAACAKAGEVCVPDSVLTANGKKNATCKFVTDGRPGACTSTLLKQIGDNKAILKNDACAADEGCGPCVNPLDGSDTHLCDEMGAHESACSSASAGGTTETCCHGMGACMGASAVPADARDKMSQEVCPDEKLCVPASMVNGQPRKCSTLGFSGVCLDVCFAAMLKATKPVLGGDCSPTEVCVPCLVGKGYGMPGCE